MDQIQWSEQELNTLKTSIVSRVRRVWFFKTVLAPAALVLAASGTVLLYAIKTQHVAVIAQNIFERLTALDLIGLAQYFLVAVQKTELDLFAISVSATLLVVYFGRRLIRETIHFWMKGANLARIS
ncbi:MAG: hypothetical protein Q8R12_01505 [bacterium]|nr:hypothetical protein [bacterium]